MNIKDFFDHNFKVVDYTDFADLQWILEKKLMLPHTGRKAELMDRIVDNDRFHPNKLYNWLSHEDLKIICKQMGLPVTGNKPTLWLRILEETNYFDDAYPDLRTRLKRTTKLAERTSTLIVESNDSVRQGYVSKPEIDMGHIIISGRKKTKLSRIKDHLKENRDVYGFIGMIIAILTFILTFILK